MKVLISTSTFGILDRGPVMRIEKAGLVPVLNPHGRKLSDGELYELLVQHCPVGILAGTERLSREALAASKGLKVVSRVGTGWDNVDHSAAEGLGIAVFRTSDSHAASVAELAIGLMLSVLRHIASADRKVRKGEWKPIMGQLLRGKTIGVVGYGKVGRYLAKSLAGGFNANPVGYDPYVAGPDWGEGCVRAGSLEELLRESDIISLHIPGGSGVVIGEKEIALMKKGAIIINTARGGIIDEKALADALVSGHLSGAGLDVFEAEPYSGPLTGMENVVMTMHMGSYAREARIQMEAEAVENLLNGLSEKGVLR